MAVSALSIQGSVPIRGVVEVVVRTGILGDNRLWRDESHINGDRAGRADGSWCERVQSGVAILQDIERFG
jgi:hypothetical protein